MLRKGKAIGWGEARAGGCGGRDGEREDTEKEHGNSIPVTQ